MSLHLLHALWCLLFVSQTLETCSQPSPAFPLPDYTKHQAMFQDALHKVQNELDSLVANKTFETTAFSIEVTSSEQTLWSSFHTARDQDALRPGAVEVNGNSVYRIASITKTFTTLGILQQHAAGHLNLDDSVDTYLTELKGSHNGSIPWKDITLRSLVSQLSGLPRDWPRDGIMTKFADPTNLGLPPRNNSAFLPHCYAYEVSKRCSEADLITAVKSLKPLFAPNAKSTYSNIAFELLGLLLTKVTNMPYEEYIASSILGPIGMSATTFITPPDSVAVLPKNESWYFSIDAGVHNPTGGLYSTSSDLSLYLRYILTHYNGLHTGSNWLQPASFSAGSSSYYGMPWEIYRAPTLFPLRSLPVTFFTKAGVLPGYVSIIALAPEYDLGITILVGGNATLLPKLLEAVSVPLIETADVLAGLELKDRYTGTYTTTHLNSTLTLAYTPAKGLYVDRWISNGTDFFSALSQISPGAMDDGARLQLMPTLLYVDEERKMGERWRALPVSAERGEEIGVWDDFCMTDMDGVMYDGRPLNEVVFWEEEVELTAFRIRLLKLKRVEEGVADERLVVQQFESGEP